MGFTPDLIVGVWIGFDAERTLGSYTGGRAATPIWTDFMERALEGRPIRDFAKPDDVTLVRVDANTGLLATGGRSSGMQAFIAGTEPRDPTATPTPAADAPAKVAEAQPAAPAGGAAREPESAALSVSRRACAASARSAGRPAPTGCRRRPARRRSPAACGRWPCRAR